MGQIPQKSVLTPTKTKKQLFKVLEHFSTKRRNIWKEHMWIRRISIKSTVVDGLNVLLVK